MSRIVRIFLVLIILGFSSCIYWNLIDRMEIDRMIKGFENRYGVKPDLLPVVVGLWYDDVSIFSVPEDNAVGTDRLFNSVTLLRFCGEGIEYDVVKSAFIEGVGGGERYAGLFSDSWIGYTQGRGFLLFNVKNGSFLDHLVTPKMTEWLEGVIFTGRNKFEFIFKVLRANDDCLLRIVNFDMKGGFNVISEINLGKIYFKPQQWALHNGTVFVYYNDSVKIRAYDMNFNEVRHPLSEIFNNLKRFRCLTELVIHPTLPIAILVEKDREFSGLMKVYLVRWEEKEEERRFLEIPKSNLSIFTNGIRFSVENFEFSPDGRWLVFMDWSDDDDDDIENGPVFMAIPFDGSRDFPIGEARVLGTLFRENVNMNLSSTAWIRKPLSYVVSDGKVLYKWELDKLKRKFFDER